MQHDMFLCKSCYDNHQNCRGADSIKNILGKDYQLWDNMLQRVNEMAKRLEVNLGGHSLLIDTLRDYYNVENVNPSGLIYANGTGSFTATIKDNFTSMNAVEVKTKE